MAIEVETNFDAKKIGEEIRAKQKKSLGVALEEAAREIVERSRAQQSVDGGRFKALSAPYAKYKKKKGRQGVPDLTFTGAMLRAIQTKIEETTSGLLGLIFFSSTKEAEKARGNMKLRKFFGLSKQQMQKIIKAIGGK